MLLQASSGSGGPTPVLSTCRADEPHVVRACDADVVRGPVAGATECTPCVLRHGDRVQISGEPAAPPAERLEDLLSKLQQTDKFAIERRVAVSQPGRRTSRSSSNVWRDHERGMLTLKGRVHVPHAMTARGWPLWCSLHD